MRAIDHEIADRAYWLSNGARILEVVAVVAGGLGVIGGIALAFQTRTDAELLASETHPYVAAGVSVVIYSIVVAIFGWCIARALNLYGLHLSALHDDGSEAATDHSSGATKPGRDPLAFG